MPQNLKCCECILTSILTRSHWFPLVGCGVPVGLNDGSMKPSLAYVWPPVLFEPWVNLFVPFYSYVCHSFFLLLSHFYLLFFLLGNPCFLIPEVLVFSSFFTKLCWTAWILLTRPEYQRLCLPLHRSVWACTSERCTRRTAATSTTCCRCVGRGRTTCGPTYAWWSTCG